MFWYMYDRWGYDLVNLWLLFAFTVELPKNGWNFYSVVLAVAVGSYVILKLLCAYIWCAFDRDLEMEQWTKLLNDLKQHDEPT